MKGRYSWKELLPEDETRTAIDFMIDVWEQVSQAYPDDFKYSKREPDLTEMLTFHLRSLEGNHYVLGFWNTEAHMSKRSGAGKLSVIRKDLSYQSNYSGVRLDLTFEFKKITTSSLAAYRGDNGMKRFVDGDYAIGSPLAFMVGIIKPGDKATICNLKASLDKAKTQTSLNMTHDLSGRYLISPSEVAPPSCDFDTLHTRPIKKAPTCGPITLGHIFVECPV